MDALSDFFDRVQLKGRLFFAGKVDGTLDIDKPPGTAFIHILEQGGIDLVRPGHPSIPVREPSILLCPGSCRYKLRASGIDGANIVCASFEFGAAIGRTLPFGVTDTIIFKFSELDHVLPVMETLLAEFRGAGPGRHKGMSVLFEYILILLVRQAIARQAISRGVLFAMLDAQVGKALAAIHQQPEQPWSVGQLAALAGISRSSFSARFAELVGEPPISYLAAWRIKLAQDLMAQGVALKIVAASAGFSSQAAFTRAFAHETGMPPGEWLKRA
ncbi:AraC family transcriptional regulator [Rugamonas sp.]|uniref:AraC family transcriptional regulator n=1 Tax=Rugamonas sp. TaxID=1926287 RepID=UPI0025E83BC5|nr:AraC family transcriptional regulator [Rugamonas sp.]